MKKILCVILSVLFLIQMPAFSAFAVEGKTPVLSYSFENSANAPDMFGNASLVYDEDKQGNVLSLDGSNGTYAKIPQGFFDGKDEMTVQFDFLPKENTAWGFFAFCIGKDDQKYSYFRIKDNVARYCITTATYNAEHATEYTKKCYNQWMHIALVYDNTSLKMYIDGELVGEENTGLTVSDLGSNLISYIGRSFYSGDAYYNACYDNFEVYDSVLSASEIEDTYEANIPDMPVLRYTFEDGSIKPSLSGNASTVYNDQKDGKVLSLDGTSNTFAEIPQGFFDGRDVMTIQFDILPNDQWGNFFTFCLGADNTKYSFFRIKNDDNRDVKLIRNCISTSSWQNEKAVDYERANYNGWMHIAMVYDNYTLKLYVDGTKVSENNDTGIKVSDLGNDLKSYFGKSLYDGDGWYNGCFDNFEVYDRALTDEEVEETYEKNVASNPDLRYTFEDGTTKPTMYGNASAVYDDERKSKVLSLDGTSNTYAQIPTGYFDGKDKMTVMFDVKSINNSGNFFTYTIGKDTEKYDFFRVRGSEIRNAITIDNYYNEAEVKTTSDSTDSWMHIALVFDDYTEKLYVNGTLAATNNNAHKISDLGTDLISYFGKSFYSGDGYFHGKFDNFEVYNRVLGDTEIRNKAMNNLPLLIGVKSGVVITNVDDVRGTDNHTSVSTTINRDNGEITSIIQRRQNPKLCPVKFSFLNEDCKLYIDGNEYPAECTIDLSYDRSVEIECNGEAESYTLKAAEIANNPVLPGMYADPDIDILDGKYWIYPTTDGTPGWGGTQFHAFSSPDMMHWTDEGVILDNQDKNPGVNANGIQIASSKWSNGNAWAPSIEGKNGNYYFYYCGRILSEYESQYGDGMAIGVAVASSPEGPYTASEEPILYPKMMSDANFGFSGQVIDPAIYTEGDTSYILFGNGTAAMAELNSNMTTVKTSTLRTIGGLEGFRESVAVFKRNGTYFWHWSCDDTGSENYQVRYGTSSSLTGSVTYKGMLVEKDVSNGILATGHQSVIYIPETDKAFIAYHRFYTPLSIGGNVGHRRETCIDEITFNGNLLNQVTPTMEGVGKRNIQGLPVSEPVQEFPNDGYNLTLDKKINVNFFIDTEYYEAEGGTIKYSYIKTTEDKSAEREEFEVSVNSLEKQENGTRKLTLDAAPAQIAEKYYIEIYNSSNELQDTIETSIEDYCSAVLDNDDLSDYHAIAKSLLNYGALADEYFGYAAESKKVTGNDYSVSHSDDYKDAVDVSEFRSKAKASVTPGDVTVTGVSYVALLNPEFRFYIDEENEVWAALTDVSIVGDGLEAEMVKTSNGNCVRVTGLKSNDFAKTFTLRIGTTEITYNGYAYLYTVLTNSNDTALKDLAKGIYRYAKACEEKFS